MRPGASTIAVSGLKSRFPHDLSRSLRLRTIIEIERRLLCYHLPAGYTYATMTLKSALNLAFIANLLSHSVESLFST